MRDKIEIEMNWSNENIFKEIKQMIASRIHERHIKKALQEVAADKLKMSPEAVENVIQKAFEKATKDIAKWQLIRDFIQLSMKVKRIEKTLLASGITLKYLTKQEAESKSNWDTQFGRN